MSQYADGGIIASKPYASSGNYINKMSDYCNDCHYRVREKVGDSACPFNALYWNFIHQHSELLKNNQRMSMIYRSWEKMNSEDREQIINKAQQLIEGLENL
jgi:deoxyribodipyrimidine photolyase-related protein